MVEASSSGAVDSGLIPKQVKPMTVKLVFTVFLLDGEFTYCTCACCWNKPASLLVVPVKRHLAGLPDSDVVNRWTATPTQARYSAFVAFSW